MSWDGAVARRVCAVPPARPEPLTPPEGDLTPQHAQRRTALLDTRFKDTAQHQGARVARAHRLPWARKAVAACPSRARTAWESGPHCVTDPEPSTRPEKKEAPPKLNGGTDRTVRIKALSFGGRWVFICSGLCGTGSLHTDADRETQEAGKGFHSDKTRPTQCPHCAASCIPRGQQRPS
jgi:hypothetical protein